MAESSFAVQVENMGTVLNRAVSSGLLFVFAMSVPLDGFDSLR
jgi:hypothetical protein